MIVVQVREVDGHDRGGGVEAGGGRPVEQIARHGGQQAVKCPTCSVAGLQHLRWRTGDVCGQVCVGFAQGLGNIGQDRTAARGMQSLLEGQGHGRLLIHSQ